MSKSLPIEFDDKSIEILKNVDSVHRNSLVNVALAMISKTSYYKTLSGESSDDALEVASLGSLDDTPSDSPKIEAPKPTPSTTWDDL